MDAAFYPWWTRKPVATGGGGGGGALDWFSDVTNSALGTGDIVDSTAHAAKWLDTTGTGTVNLAVANPPAGFPAGLTHCWQATLSVTARMVRTVGGLFSSPTVGASRWFRYYMRFDFANGQNTGSMHPIQVDAFADLHYEFKVISVAGGIFVFRFHYDPLVSSNGAFDLTGTLAVNTWYRVEYELYRNAAGTFNIRSLNIYNGAGTLVASIANFINANDGTTTLLAANPSITFTDATIQDFWQGNNGPAGADEGPSFYFAAFATLLNSSPGAYSAGRG